ncbi:MAG: hypothetical protein HY420_05020 [Candidatus Kerfeldbacteria bacterium]|nr:hypothetical protein [Candidatus Kerfeldbacteria bacterium]
MTEVKLNQVFGITTDIPTYTYVDRQELDERFAHYLASQKHIVIHGASKQGKSCLRKKQIDSSTSLVIQCLPTMEHAEDVWRAALEKAGVPVVAKTTRTVTEGDHIDGTLETKAGVPGLVGVKGNASGGLESTKSASEEIEEPGEGPLSILAAYLRDNSKRLILEDFHYLPDEVRKSIAFGLKALYEEKAYVVVIGIWSEQNLLNYYNGDLTGRIEEINLTWSEEELNEVLTKGEGTLNVQFAPGLKSQLIESAFGNVGLLQRLSEKICLEAGVVIFQPQTKIISDIELLNRARTQLVNEIRQRYTGITEVFKEGMRADAELQLYTRIYNELVDASELELINGISYHSLLERIRSKAGSGVTIRQSDLTSALDRVERLQAKKRVTPLLVSYSKNVRKLFLNDREFMFYRKYSGDNPEDLKINVDE